MRRSALMLLVLAAAPLLHAATPPPAGERWTRLDAGNLTIYSNAPDRATRAAAENFVRFREVLGAISHLSVQSPLPTYVYLFRDPASFGPYRDAVVGKGHDDVRGMFDRQLTANWALIQARSELGLDRVVYHELGHYFVGNTVAGIPHWLGEGMAGFYETLQPLGLSNNVTIGLPPPGYLEGLRGSGLMPLRELFAFQAPLDRGANDLRVAQFYEESWLLVHYLMIGNPQRGAALGPFLEALLAGQPTPAAFQAAFHATMEDVDKELGGYLGRGRFKAMQYDVAPSHGPIGQPVVMPRDQILFALGDLLAHTTPSEGAETFLSEAVKLNPNHAVALADLAWIRNDDALYEKSVAVAGNDPRPYVEYSATMTMRLQAAARDGETVPHAQIEKARELVRRALRLAPDDVQANAVLGGTYTFGGEDPKSGIAASDKAFRLAPARNDVAADLVLLYARNNQPALARAMIERVLAPTADEPHLAEATENLALAEFLRAREMGTNPAARALLEHAKARTTNPKLQAKIDALLAQ